MILMKNLILILIFAAVGLNTMASNPVHVIITAGQSNTDGRTPNEDLPAVIGCPVPNFKVFFTCYMVEYRQH